MCNLGEGLSRGRRGRRLARRDLEIEGALQSVPDSQPLVKDWERYRDLKLETVKKVIVKLKHKRMCLVVCCLWSAGNPSSNQVLNFKI